MLQDLEARWRDERTPQAGVRLAEAVQESGDAARAEAILDAVEKRLESEPRDLASRVALGAMRMALGQPEGAARVLEQVVAADATHLKANKLLVEVYIELDQRDRARDRLDLYRLLNEGDPEIEALEGLVVGVTVDAAAEEAAAAGGRQLRLAGGDPFADLTALAAGAAAGDVFELPPVPAATATLGALYQEQGHRQEAERVYRDVIAREPENRRALEGLAALADAPPQEEAAAAAEPPVPAVALPDGLDDDADRERRIGILRDYLERIQRGRRAAAR